MTKTITISYVLPGSPEKVWRTLTEAQLLAKWLMENDIAPIPGHKFTMRSRPMGDWDGTVSCEVIEAIPNEKLAYSWRGGSGKTALDTVVTWTLEAHGTGTKLLLEHSGFTDDTSAAFNAMSGGWASKQAELAALSA
ncbi:MAG TPA: SRPBCC domain-containing protein [Kofleriaceae bacterium]